MDDPTRAHSGADQLPRGGELLLSSPWQQQHLIRSAEVPQPVKRALRSIPPSRLGRLSQSPRALFSLRSTFHLSSPLFHTLFLTPTPCLCPTQIFSLLDLSSLTSLRNIFLSCFVLIFGRWVVQVQKKRVLKSFLRINPIISLPVLTRGERTAPVSGSVCVSPGAMAGSPVTV